MREAFVSIAVPPGDDAINIDASPTGIRYTPRFYLPPSGKKGLHTGPSIALVTTENGGNPVVIAAITIVINEDGKISVRQDTEIEPKFLKGEGDDDE